MCKWTVGQYEKENLHLNYECESELDYPDFMHVCVYELLLKITARKISDFFAPEVHGFQGALVRLVTNLAMNAILSSANKKS